MSWAQKRRLMYISIVVGFFLCIFLVFLYINRKPPTCSDNKLNQDEIGVDCGGVCSSVRLCSSQVSAPLVLWSRVAKVQDGLYNALAYVQNSNLTAAQGIANYSFSLYDKENSLIYQRYGVTSIPASRNLAIIETGLLTKYRVPARVEFSFTNGSAWVKTEAETDSLYVVDKFLQNASTTPRFKAIIENKSLQPIKNIEAIVIIYDEEDNAMTFSKTFIDSILPNQQETANFTWPEKFAFKPGRSEILLRSNSQLK